jgi:predicted nucleotide-binding protein (sugar kinase/HSP70/actin superfamily)
VLSCPCCPNACLLSIVDFGDGRSHVSGNRCSRGLQVGRLSPDSLPGFLPGQGIGQSQLADPLHAGNRGHNHLKPPNLFALEQKLLARYGKHEAPLATEEGKPCLRIGIPCVLNLYETLPFWHTLLSCLGFSVVLPELDDTGRNRSAPLAEGLETIPSESVCYPAKTAHAHCAGLVRAKVDAILMPTYERGQRCPVCCLYASVLEGNMPALRDSEVALVSPRLQAIRPQALVDNPLDSFALFEALDSLATLDRSPAHLTEEGFQEALRKALDEQRLFEGFLTRATEKAFAWLDATGERGVVLACRPYQVDRQLSHGIDTQLSELGFAVFSYAGLRPLVKAFLSEKGKTPLYRHGEQPGDALADDAVRYEGALPSEGSVADNAHTVIPGCASSQSSGVEAWPPARTLAGIAAFTAAHAKLELVCLYSFGCGFDALSLGPARDIVEQAGKTFTALKVDDIVDLAHVRIRLRTLAETLRPACLGTQPDAGHSPQGGMVEGRAKRRIEGRAEGRVEGRVEGRIEGRAEGRVEGRVEGSVVGRAEGRIEDLALSARLGALTREDLACARRRVPHDVCFVVSALAGAAIRMLENNPSITCLTVPEICTDCLLGGLPLLVHEALGWAPGFEWEAPVARPAAPLPAPTGRPRVGILGNALLCFDGFANRQVIRLIRSLGYDPVLPCPEALLTEDLRYIGQIEEFLKQGINDVLYLQAFGCLKGHVWSRGSLRCLGSRFPELRLTIVDYDHDVSPLNQENRIRLALSSIPSPSAKT